MRFLCGIFVFMERFSELVMEKSFIFFLPISLGFLVIRKIFGSSCSYASNIEFWLMIS